MDKLCFRKYRNRCLRSGGMLILSVLLGWSIMAAGTDSGVLLIILGVFGFGFSTAWHLYFLLHYRKKCEDLPPQTMVIFNWQSSGARWATGSLIVRMDGKEYASPFHFSTEEAQALVGKTVSGVIIDETLLIYEIVE